MNKLRFILVLILSGLLLALIVITLINIQIINGEYYYAESQKRLARSVPIKAQRGEIFDRNMTPIVKNSMGLAIELHKTGIPLAEQALVIDRIIKLLDTHGIKYSNNIPITPPPFEWNFVYSDAEERGVKIKQWMDRRPFLKNIETAEEVITQYRKKYDISPMEFDNLSAYRIISVLCEMENRGFNTATPFIFANDVNIDIVSIIKENQDEYKGVDIVADSVRIYAAENVAPHILGRTDVIYAEEYPELKAKGYAMNDIVGKDGIELSLEDSLRGKDGERSVEYSIDGRLLRVIDSRPAVSGKYAVLTLDIELQKAAEDALAGAIELTKRQGFASLSGVGADCDSGAIVALDVNTGEVLAMASYPAYNLATFSEDFAENAKNPANPILNRAISGAYEPGSTFKMVPAIAGMSEGVIKPYEIIRDEGVYMYYAPSYTPACHIWISSRQTHGDETVSGAVRDSCNYFFYETGRRLGINKLNLYSEKFGLGILTGIELAGEVEGILAGPEYRELIGERWYPGDTIQAAIGQSNNMFTPIQLVSYTATIANGGKRYKPHLVKELHSYDEQDVEEITPEVVDVIEIKQEYLDQVYKGMREVITEGTASGAFAGCDVEVAGKTGTAEVPNGSENGIFVGFAPLRNPRIAVVVVMEHGAGTNVAGAARKVFEKYFEIEN